MDNKNLFSIGKIAKAVGIICQFICGIERFFKVCTRFHIVYYTIAVGKNSTYFRILQSCFLKGLFGMLQMLVWVLFIII